MDKRTFRSAQIKPTDDTPAYPTLDSFDNSRRQFLVRLGGTLLGAGALAACGGRPVSHAPDGGQVTAGKAPLPDSRADQRLDPLGGEAPQPDSRVDQQPDFPMAGEPPQPPAKQDLGPDWGVYGDVTYPDAAVDKKDLTASPGYAPQLDAAVDCDGGACPKP